MVKKRPKIPPNIEANLLYKNDRTCCICRDKSKGIQIHHIDENPDNNSIENLAVICTHHHDEIHRKGGMTKRFSPELVKKYKHEWEQAVLKERTKGYPPLYSEKGLEKILFEFEIRKTVCEINSLNDDDISEIQKKLDFLYSIYLSEGYSEQILRAIDNTVILVTLGNKNKAALIAKSIHEYCWHLVGPKDVPMSRDDLKNLKIIIGILGTIGNFSGEFDKDIKTIMKVADSFEFVLNISIWYNKKEIAVQGVKEIKRIIKACKATYEDEKPLTTGINILNKVLKEYREYAEQENITWIDEIKF